jgi:hypothetical protein
MWKHRQDHDTQVTRNLETVNWANVADDAKVCNWLVGTGALPAKEGTPGTKAGNRAMATRALA